eukprot:CFRG6720T1
MQEATAATFLDWKKTYNEHVHQSDSLSLFDKAVIGGALSRYPAFAFAAGYQCAIRALVPDIQKLDHQHSIAVTSLCVTEQRGNRPRHIDTYIKDGRISGKKTFASCGSEADYVLIAAKNEIQHAATDGQPNLSMVLLPTNQKGIMVTQRPAMGFVDEISHAEVLMDDVMINDVAIPESINGSVPGLLPGDGYTQYMKPFRTIEDTYVTAALLGYHLSLAFRLTLPTGHIESLTSQLLALSALSKLNPLARETHVAMAGVLRLTDSILEPTHIAAIGPSTAQSPEFALWKRDSKLLLVAKGIREARTRKSWESIQKSCDQTTK